MSTEARTTQESTVRPTHITLGIDADGRTHHYRTTDESVHVVGDVGRAHREDVTDRHVDEWMAYVDARVGWDQRDYGVGMIETIGRALDP